MYIAHMRVSALGTNCYLIGDKDAGVCAIIDPGDRSQDLVKMIEESSMELKYILVTHGHYDHVLALPELTKHYPNAIVYVHAEEVDPSGMPNNYMKLAVQNNMQYASDGDVLPLGSFNIDVHVTPGHSKGSLVFCVDGNLFTGDTLFQGTCGRTDFAGGSYTEMLASLKRLHDMNGDYQVFPGHEGFTTLAKERANNSFMREAAKQS